MRKNIKQSINSIKKIKELIDDVNNSLLNSSIDEKDTLLHILDTLKNMYNNEMEEVAYTENFAEVINILVDKKIKYKSIFSDYDLDFEILLEDIEYKCELVIDESDDEYEETSEIKRMISVKKLGKWYEEIKDNFGILYYFKKCNRLYFYPISNQIKSSDIKNEHKHAIKLNILHII